MGIALARDRKLQALKPFVPPIGKVLFVVEAEFAAEFADFGHLQPDGSLHCYLPKALADRMSDERGNRERNGEVLRRFTAGGA